jgi:hypothetical protein
MSFGAARVAPEKAVFRPALPMSVLPGLNGADMTKMSYAEQLKHPNWQRKRLEVLESADWACEQCDGRDVTLHVHHRRYVKGRMAWEYSEQELQVLCEPCHHLQHEKQELLDRILMSGECGYDNLELAIGLLSGFLEVKMCLPVELESDCRKMGREFVYGQIAGVLGDVPWDVVAKLLGQINEQKLNPAEVSFIRWLEDMKGC